MIYLDVYGVIALLTVVYVGRYFHRTFGSLEYDEAVAAVGCGLTWPAYWLFWLLVRWALR